MSGDFKAEIMAGKIVDGMSFNQRAWAMTVRIPKGSVMTYGQLAKALNTTAARAVGHAMNRNPYAPQVPCHRVVGSDGSLTGYAGGLPKKRAMLEREGVVFRGERVDLDASCMGRTASPTLFTHA